MNQRINSVDIVRGIVMVLMAIDHVRLYGGIPAGGPEPALFFTRWVTHFCVSGFVFFAGTAIYFHARKLNNINALSRYLFIRGILLVILELTLIRFCWTFNLDLQEFMLAGVIWMLGWCMVLMSLLVRLKISIAGIIGVAIVLFQQIFSFVPRLFPESFASGFAWFWNFFYPSGYQGSEHFAILYTLIPWIGVMAAGYWFGKLFFLPEDKRDRIFLRAGLSAILIFILAASTLIIVGPEPEHPAPFIFRLLNQNKYPASQLFLLMTLGPLILILPWAEKSKGWLAKTMLVFGRVPLFYYVLHILLIHVLALLTNLIRSGKPHQEWYSHAPFYTQQEPGVRWHLWQLYLVFIIAEIILYFLCRWYMNYKQTHPETRWLKYL